MDFRKINMSNKGTVYCTCPNIAVLDDKKNLFYFHPNKERKINFNLPKGVFYINCDYVIKPFESYKRKDTTRVPEIDITIETLDNPNKATIYPALKKIVFDEQLSKTTFKPSLYFILLHELAHLIVGGSLRDKNGKIIFDAETNCDKIAENWMLENGFNPSQIETAKRLTLSSKERHKCNYENIKSLKK